MGKIDALKAEIDFIKTILCTAIIGGMISISLYNVQNSSNVINVTIAVVALGIVAILLRMKHKELLKKLEDA